MNAIMLSIQKTERCGLPETIKEIGKTAFADCTSVTSIRIPASVVQIQSGTFNDCKNLTIHAPIGSYAEQYAKENNILFVAE